MRFFDSLVSGNGIFMLPRRTMISRGRNARRRAKESLTVSNPREVDTNNVLDRPVLPQCPLSIQQIEAVFAPLLGSYSVRVCEVFSGNINTIVKVDIEGLYYGLRVRTHEQVYRYEPDLIKEAFVIW